MLCARARSLALSGLTLTISPSWTQPSSAAASVERIAERRLLRRAGRKPRRALDRLRRRRRKPRRLRRARRAASPSGRRWRQARARALGATRGGEREGRGAAGRYGDGDVVRASAEARRRPSSAARASSSLAPSMRKRSPLGVTKRMRSGSRPKVPGKLQPVLHRQQSGRARSEVDQPAAAAQRRGDNPRRARQAPRAPSPTQSTARACPARRASSSDARRVAGVS